MLNFPFSAALLAGGKSSRMGQDKAGLLIEGIPLWERQIELLKQLEPTQLFICGRPDGPYVGRESEVVTDETPDLGPLGGLMTAMRHASTDTLLLLAVDLPGMDSKFLKKLLHRARMTSRSIVPVNNERSEPLAAIYHLSCLPLVEQLLRSGQRSMRSFLDQLEQHQMLELYTLTIEEMPLFVNVNTPADLARFQTLPNNAPQEVTDDR